MEPQAKSSPARAAAVIVILVLATIAALWPVMRCGFVGWDDPQTVAENPNIVSPSVGGVLRYWKRPAMGLYVPVTYTAWSVIGWLSPSPDLPTESPQLDPALFHGTNLLVHILSTLLVGAIVRRIVGNDVAACIGALLFALHPLQVETVAWVSGLKDLLSAFFSLLAIWQYMAFAESPPETFERRLRYFIVLAAAGLAMLSKPSAMVLPLVLLLLDVLILRRTARQIARGILPVALVCLPCAVLAMVVQHPPRSVALWQRPIVVMDSISFYVAKFFWPLKLAPDYGRRPVDALHDRLIGFCWVIPVLLAAGLWVIRKRAPRVVAGLLIFLLIVLPTLGFVNTLFQDKSTVADHYAYFAMFGLSIAIAAIVARLGSRAAVVAAIVLVAAGIQSFRQAWFWHDSYSLFARTVQVSPRSWSTRIALAAELFHRGDFGQAQQRMQEAIDIYPSSRTYLAMGQLMLLANRPADAIDPLQRALEYEPGIQDGRLNLANAYLRSGRASDAQRELESLHREHPDDPRVDALLREAQRAI
jgi:Tfp pilus assembly protein PilF